MTEEIPEGMFLEKGRGRKQCPRCQLFTGVRRLECPGCGQPFEPANIRKFKAPSEPSKAPRKAPESAPKVTPLEPSKSRRETYRRQLVAVAGRCPIPFPERRKKPHLIAWMRACQGRFEDELAPRVYMAWIREHYEFGRKPYIKLRELVNTYIMQNEGVEPMTQKEYQQWLTNN